jgi:o-succinylbenzoate synthase
MRLASVEVIPYALPFKEPYVTARGRLEQREMVLLRLRSEEGLLGLGEAVPLSLRGGATLATVVAELRALAERDRLDEAALEKAVPALSAPARCAALTALHDLRDRNTATTSRSSTGEAPTPVEARPVACNATLVAGEPSAVAADAERWAAEGFTTFKLKLGTGNDVGQVQTVRDAVGSEARIRIDANAAWDASSAVRVLSKIEPLEIELVEQPAATLAALAEIGAATSIPIAGDESVGSCADAVQATRMGACEIAATKLSKVGGPEEAVKIAEVMPSYLSSALDGPVGIAAAAQVARTLDARDPSEDPVFAHGLATQRLFASTIASVECELRDGMLYLPPGPGLGVEIDEESLTAHRL